MSVLPTPLERSARLKLHLPLPAVLFLTAAGLRLVAFATFYFGSVLTGHHGSVDPFDSVVYDRWAWYTAEHMRSGTLPDLRLQALEGSWDVGFTYVVAVQYALFGHHPEIPRVINCLIAAVSAPTTYLAARQTSLGEKLAARAGWLVAVWPLSLFWAGFDLLKDPLVWFFLSIALLAFAASSWKRRSILGSFAAGGAYLVRNYMGPVIALALVLATLVRRDARGLIATLAGLTLLQLALLASGFPPAWEVGLTSTNATVTTSGESPVSQCNGFSSGSTCSGQPILTPKGLALRFAVGVPTVLFGPGLKPLRDFNHPTLDWGMYPGLLVWIALLPFTVLGLSRALMRRDTTLWGVALFGLGIWASLALIYAGQALRQREMAFPATLIFTSLGLERPWPRRWWWAYGAYWVFLLAGLVWEAGLV